MRFLIDRLLQFTNVSRLILVALLGFAAYGQGEPVTLIGHVEAMITLAADESQGDVTVTLDPSTGGGDLLQIRSTLPGIVVSVELPTGQVINQANASSYSYTWETFDSAEVDPAASGSIGSPAPGRHELIRFPAGQPAGAYRILAARGAASGPAGVLVRFESLSGIRFGVNARGQFHSPNQPVTLAAVLMANETAVSNASVSGSANVLVASPTGVALGGWELRSKVDQGDGTSHYFYGATLQNSGSAFVDFRAKPSTDDDAIHFDTDEMMFRGVAQGEPKPCNLCLGFVGPTSPEPSPASFTWKLYADAPAIPVTLSDSTPEYPATGDGVYTGTFTSPYAGEHWIDLKAEGVGPNQRPFVRVAGVTVRVEPRPAYFLGFSDAAHDTNADGIPDEVRVVALISGTGYEPVGMKFQAVLRQLLRRPLMVRFSGALLAWLGAFCVACPRRFAIRPAGRFRG